MKKIGVLLLIMVGSPLLADEPALKLTGPVVNISSAAPHSAFTDLIAFQGRYYCIFREGAAHAAGAGKIRVMVSTDGKKWQSSALLEKESVDLRDPHICTTPDGKLMINGGAAFPATRNPVKDFYSWVSFSEDGEKWTAPRKILESWHWLWRITWHKGTAYGVAYFSDPKTPGATNCRTALYRSKDGIHFEKITDLAKQYTTEATLRFDGDTMICLQRRDGYKTITAQLGTSQPPYTKWTWKDLGTYLGGPNFLQDPSGNWWAAGRIYQNGPKTIVGSLDLKTGKLTPFLTLPSGGDTSYPGMIWQDGELWVSYYSSHEKKASIYLAKLKPSTSPPAKQEIEVPRDKPPRPARKGLVWMPGKYFLLSAEKGKNPLLAFFIHW